MSDHGGRSRIDELDPEPYYRQLAAILRAQIHSGHLTPGDPMPSEKALRETYGLGRDTVRNAIAVLRDEGLVVTMPQRGSYVAHSEDGT